MAFEHSAESYKASPTFTAVSGKNNWRYQQADGATVSALVFDGRRNAWSLRGKGNLAVGGDYVIPPDTGEALRTWVVPHDGWARIEGAVEVDRAGADGIHARITRNAAEVWPSRLVTHGRSESHDRTVSVSKGDLIGLGVKRGGEKPAEKALWDPVVTYVAAPEKSK